MAYPGPLVDDWRVFNRYSWRGIEGGQRVAEELSTLRAILSTTAIRWEQLVGNLPEDLLQRRPIPEEWSPAECLRHLWHAERDVFSVRLRTFIAGKDIVPYDPGVAGPEFAGPLSNLLKEFQRLRAENNRVLAELGLEDLDRSANHGEYGAVRLEEMMNEWTAHDLVHTVQAERALMQPLILASGPWRFSFSTDEMTGHSQS